MRFMIIPKPGPGGQTPEREGTREEAVCSAQVKFNDDLARAGVLIAAEVAPPWSSTWR